ncbi:MAG: NnrS family protein [Chthoniobacterales bacterium]
MSLPLAEEPFRIFFPTGVLLAIVGVSLWLLYYLGVGIPYPNVTHARLMIEGFMASFIFGFLGTAGPRLTSTPPFSPAEVATLFTLDLLAAGAHLGGAHRAGDICFLLCLLVFMRVLAKRFRQRKDSPPPNFVLVALGLVSGVVGAGLVAYAEATQYSRIYQFGSALLNECFVLLPILGVAPFFIGRLLDLPSSNLPESRAFPPEWRRAAAFAGLVGVLTIASFAIDAFGWPKTGGWLRVAALSLYVGRRMPFRGHTFLANCLRVGIVTILVGFALIAAWPIYRVAGLHIVFITGFNFIAFTVAIRVVFGHSGNLDLLSKRLWFFIATGALLYLAMVARFTADLAPAVRILHLLAAAICWLVAALVWMLKVLPKVAIAEPEK